MWARWKPFLPCIPLYTHKKEKSMISVILDIVISVLVGETRGS